MTAQQEVRFRCNRCHDEINVALVNVPTVDRLMRAPEGWTSLWIDDMTKAPFHLCPPCADIFKTLMDFGRERLEGAPG